jgi:hypothetical protein
MKSNSVTPVLNINVYTFRVIFGGDRIFKCEIDLFFFTFVNDKDSIFIQNKLITSSTNSVKPLTFLTLCLVMTAFLGDSNVCFSVYGSS